jgi:excisionase family DNA binding protein
MNREVTRATVSVSQAARMLGCHPRTLRKALREGRFPGILINGRWRVSVSVVERALAGDSLPT